MNPRLQGRSEGKGATLETPTRRMLGTLGRDTVAGLNEKGGEVDGRATLPRYLEGLTLTELEPHPTIEV